MTHAGDGGGGEFVEGWLVAQLLGEGAYGEVRLLVHSGSGARVALKASRAGRGEGAAERGAREAALHRALRHPHVVRCLGARRHLEAHYTFLEYLPGGELFDRIEPARGMPAAQARRYWRHLLLGLQYLHARGVAHRDIKPENLLLDEHDNLKISDFGLATLFRHGERERLLGRVCGTVPYAAPEVLAAAERPYRAPPADLWAAGVVLRAMLTGELPWERADESDARYSSWARGEGGGGGAGGLLRRALHPAASRRATLPQLLHHRWTCADTAYRADGEEQRTWSSQPAGGGGGGSEAGGGAGGGELSAAAMEALISSSQPAHSDELLAASPLTQAGVVAGGGEGALARVARRMTRVWVAGGAEAALEGARAALCGAGAGLAARRTHAHMLTVECERGLLMRAWPVLIERPAPGVGVGEGGERTLLEFRRWRGCGMHFKRRYMDVRDALRPLAPPAAHRPTPPALDEPMEVA